MTGGKWTEERVTGAFLVAGLLVGIVSFMIMVASGTLGAAGRIIGGSLKHMALYYDTFRLVNLIFAIDWVVHLVGLALLAQLLAKAGQGQIAAFSISLIVITAVTGLLHGTWNATVSLWAGAEELVTGVIPEFYDPINTWIGDSARVGFSAHYIAMVGFGWGILRSNILSSSIGWLTIGWCSLWGLASFASIGIPALPFIMPAIIGMALLSKAPESG